MKDGYYCLTYAGTEEVRYLQVKTISNGKLAGMQVVGHITEESVEFFAFIEYGTVRPWRRVVRENYTRMQRMVWAVRSLMADPGKYGLEFSARRGRCYICCDQLVNAKVRHCGHAPLVKVMRKAYEERQRAGSPASVAAGSRPSPLQGAR